MAGLVDDCPTGPTAAGHPAPLMVAGGRLLIEESLDTGDHASAFYANDVGPLVGARQIMRRRVSWVQRRCSFPL